MQGRLRPPPLPRVPVPVIHDHDGTRDATLGHEDDCPIHARTERGYAKRAAKLAEKTARAKTRFLDAYRHAATVSHAAVATRVHRATHYTWLETDEAYAAQFKAAEEDAVERLEAEARRRAVEGSASRSTTVGNASGT